MSRRVRNGSGALAVGVVTATLLAVPAPAVAGVGDAVIDAPARLIAGDLLRSSNGAFTVTVQSDGNVVERHGAAAVWTTATAGNPGAVLDVQTDGNLVVRSAAGRAVWSSGTAGRTASELYLADDGELQVFPAAAGGAIWTNHVGDVPRRSTLTAGQSVRSDAANPRLTSANGRFSFQPVEGGVSAVEDAPGFSSSLWHRDDGRGGGQGIPGVLTMQTDGNLVLRGTNGVAYWSTHSTGGGNRFTIQDDGNFVVRRRDNAVAWASGTTGVILAMGESAGPGRRFVSSYTGWEAPFVTVVQGDGNVVTRDVHNRAVWSTGTSGNPGARLTVQTDGNMVVRRPDGRAVWQTGTSRCGPGGGYNVMFGVLYRGAPGGRVWTTSEGDLGVC